MAPLYRVAGAGEIARRRKLVGPGHVVEAWPDHHVAGESGMGKRTKDLPDGVGPPLPVTLSL